MTEHSEDLLSAYVDGELTDAEESAVVAHLDVCSDCRRELTEVQAARSVLRALPVVNPPREIVGESSGRQRRVVVAAGVAAGLLVAVLGLIQLTQDPPGEPVDLTSLAERHAARAILDPGPKSNKVAGTVNE